MNTMNFAKGMGVGFVLGSTIGMAVASSNAAQQQKKSCNRNSNLVGKALKTMGSIVDNISEGMGM